MPNSKQYEPKRYWSLNSVNPFYEKKKKNQADHDKGCQESTLFSHISILLISIT